jgi:hypothetical protein
MTYEPEFFDFDAAVGEIEPRPFTFTFGGEEYLTDLNVDGGKFLEFLRSAGSAKAVPLLVELFLDEAQFARITASGQKWQKWELLIDKLTEAVGRGAGDSGN